MGPIIASSTTAITPGKPLLNVLRLTPTLLLVPLR
jgi:hypothetical protein